MARLALREPYTPQVVVDGARPGAGLEDRARSTSWSADAAKAPRNPPDIRFVEDRRIYVGSARAPKGGGEVWLIRYDPREQDVAVKSGDNQRPDDVRKERRA